MAMAGRKWTDSERSYVSENYLKVPAIEIANKLGRTVKQVYMFAFINGFAGSGNRFVWTPEVLEKYRDWHAAGKSDTEFAAMVGAERHTISRQRERMGLPAHSGVTGSQPPLHARRKIAAGVARQCQRAGVDNVAQIRSKAYRDFATKNGWPSDLRPRSVQILNLLAASGVPMTRREIVAGIGLKWVGTRASLKSSDPEGSYLAHLSARGLVIRIDRGRKVTGKGKGRSCSTYSLGPVALDLLEKRCKQTAH